MTVISRYDAILAQSFSHCFRDSATMQSVLVWLAQTNFTKGLFFAPFLIVFWYAHKRDLMLRGRVLATMASCATSLMLVWCVTMIWLRPRPIDLESGHALVSAVFLRYFSDHPGLLDWGCFPSDHAAYLTALSLGLLTLGRKVGIAAFSVAVIGNGILRLITGLHYLSDFAGGVFAGGLTHWVMFYLIAIPKRKLTAGLVQTIERSYFMQALLIVGVVEMSVLFHDLRFLDTLLFGP